MKTYLMSLNAWSEDEETSWKEQCSRYVDAEVDAYLATRAQPVEAMFDFTYAELPPDLVAQRAQALEEQALVARG
jgi:2-oxoisovalerate dehydrogenase E1 component alpha subunit